MGVFEDEGEGELMYPNEDREEKKEKQYSDAFIQKRKMADLLEYTPFLLFKELLEKQIEYRLRELLVMPTGSDDVIRRTYSCGEVAGMKIALAFPSVLIDGAQATIDMQKAYESMTENE